MVFALFKWLTVALFAVAHPYYVSVTEINHNKNDKTLEVTTKIFTDDFEKVLATKYNVKVDLINPPDRKAMDKLINDYVFRHLTVTVDGKPVKFLYLGFEHEEEAVYSYIQAENINQAKKINVSVNLLHDLNENQINILHVTVDGERKSKKLDFPTTDAIFEF